jgi:hypothetical protein
MDIAIGTSFKVIITIMLWVYRSYQNHKGFLMIHGLGCYSYREPRGFGFVKFRNAEDAAVAKQEMNHQVIGGREISIVFADENRKTPKEMRLNARTRYSLADFQFQSPYIWWMKLTF